MLWSGPGLVWCIFSGEFLLVTITVVSSLYAVIQLASSIEVSKNIDYKVLQSWIRTQSTRNLIFLGENHS